MRSLLKPLSVIALLLWISPAWGEAISQLPSASSLSGPELFPVVQSGTTKQATINQISALIGAGTLTDGDKTDITVSSSGTVWNIDSNAIGLTELDETNFGTVTWGTSGPVAWTFATGGTAPVMTWDSASLTITNVTTMTQSTSLPVFGLTGTDTGAVGPVLKLRHDSSTPAASDIVTSIQAFGGSDDEEIGRIEYRLIDGSTTTEDGYWDAYADVGGSSVKQMSLGGGASGSGQVIIGPHTTPLSGLVTGDLHTPALQVIGQHSANSHHNSTALIWRSGANAFEPKLFFGKSRGTSIDYTIVQHNDGLGTISFLGANGTTADIAAEIFAVSDGTPGASNDMPGRLVFSTAADGSATPTARWRINSTGRLVGPLASAPESVGSSNSPALQVLGLTLENSSMVVGKFANDAFSGRMNLLKSRGTSTGLWDIVQNGDELGVIMFSGSDATDPANGAEIYVLVDGTPGNNDMPSLLALATSPDGSASPAARLVIKPDGGVIVGPNDTSPGAGNLMIDAEGNLMFAEAEANGDNSLGMQAPATVTTTQTCTFEDDANFIPDSCVGDGSDASDARLKTGFHLKKDAGSILDRIRVYDFVWAVDAPNINAAIVKGESGVGIKAQELYGIIPAAVKPGGNDALTDPWVWKPEVLIPYLISEVQSLRKRVLQLESR